MELEGVTNIRSYCTDKSLFWRCNTIRSYWRSYCTRWIMGITKWYEHIGICSKWMKPQRRSGYQVIPPCSKQIEAVRSFETYLKWAEEIEESEHYKTKWFFYSFLDLHSNCHVVSNKIWYVQYSCYFLIWT